ncbi:dihydrolipoyllysine-residue acetyltransferase [Paraglaciecola polaris]|uniref:Dihydrolipoamide acetyltransferase component of pyruvate dehydrogenase complex n=1 Tax=Paraglaciecola polaris LMG 21857 TaxID=1129793 RepID=K6YJA8_9ALTE|nr:dihydrolipoyllysine-residue acetyltransferase [Paraglaciecola polaris]GAC32789.1 dihydrolipoyllysine-residue acetyltransferase component of pyruvate dehydrogenase complex [Paraglaciecola polaris LMG 21857]|tara:strand:- start:88085 stop:89701 length:1617 start_codon:yes stop_codon:yes gene_type:complete
MKDFILPDIGEGIVECELLEWLVSEGDTIVEDQPVAEVMTDKATVQIPAMYSGQVKKLYYKAGEVAKVHQPLFAMEIEGEPSAAEKSENSAQINVDTETGNKKAVASEPSNNQSVGATVLETFILPDIGEGIVECELVKWLVNEGDTIEEDQPVVEVMTDKALVEIPAKHSGTIVSLCYQQGDIAKVHSALFTMHIAGEDNAGVDKDGGGAGNTDSNVSQNDVGKVNEKSNDFTANKHKVLASPAVRRVAREKDIDLSKVQGSGEKGRILKCDLASETSSSHTTGEIATDASVNQKVARATGQGATTVERISGMKAAMAKQMVHSVSTIPHFTVSEEIQMDALMALRAQLKEDFAEQGVKLSFMPFFIKALSMALKAFPTINSQVNDDCTELTYFHDHNIGMAVDGKLGLMVPNIKGVQDMSIFEIATRASELIEQARQGRLKATDLTGGTVSISNIGVLGGTVATPVINHPEAAIVALGKIQRLPRYDDKDQVVPVNIMHVSWSGDHRIIDGATMVRFNNLWKSYLEQPMTMLSNLR